MSLDPRLSVSLNALHPINTRCPLSTDGSSHIVLPPSIIPSADSIIFRESAFFSCNQTVRTLPSPVEVRAEGIRQDPLRSKNHFSPPPVHYPSLGLTVKYGTRVSTSEGQCLWAVKHMLGGIVPVPEVYGWTTDQGIGFIYMECIHGETLENRWEDLSEAERLDICAQLRLMLVHLRALKQVPGDNFIGNIAGEPLPDIVFTSSCSPPVGPLLSVKDFHDLFVKLPRPGLCHPDDPPHPFRYRVPDDVPIVFTHGDLHRSNIMISSGPNPRILALIDWGQSGWYPSYWEYCKARWTSLIGEDWETRYLPLFVERNECYDYWDYFLLTMGV